MVYVNVFGLVRVPYLGGRGRKSGCLLAPRRVPETGTATATDTGRPPDRRGGGGDGDEEEVTRRGVGG